MSLWYLAISVYHFFAARWRFKRLHGDSLLAYQARRARQTIQYTESHSLFYRKHWQGYSLADWQNLPPIDKDGMMANFDTFNTLGIALGDAMEVALRAEQNRDFAPTLKGVTVGLSSGTSGHRGLFLVSPQEQAAWAGIIFARVLHGSWLDIVNLMRKGLRVAFFLRSNSNLYESTGRFVQFQYYDLMAPISESITGLNSFQPDFLIGPPSLLTILAQSRMKGELTAHPRKVISVAEVLEPQDRQSLEAAFGAPAHQIYQCTEGLVAISCEVGNLHIQEDIVAIQTEPIPGEAAPDGLVRPILTDLWRRAQPIIRYQLNDIWKLDSAPCPCGSAFRVIRQVQGRNDDICIFSGRPVFPDTIRRMILLASEEIKEYEAVQQRPGQLTIYLTIRAGSDFGAVSEAVRRSVETILAGYACQVDGLEIVPGIPARPADVKRRRVRNLVKGVNK